MTDLDPTNLQYYVVRPNEVKTEDQEGILPVDSETLTYDRIDSNTRKRQNSDISDTVTAQKKPNNGTPNEEFEEISKLSIETGDIYDIRENSPAANETSGLVQDEALAHASDNGDSTNLEENIAVKSELLDELAAPEDSTSTPIYLKNNTQADSNPSFSKNAQSEQFIEFEGSASRAHENATAFDRLYENYTEPSSSDEYAYESDAPSEASASPANSDNESEPENIVNAKPSRKIRLKFELNEDGKPMCPTCTQAFSTVHGLRIHMKAHTREERYRCNICLEAVSTKSMLADHMKTHKAPEDPMDCPLCTEKNLSKNQYSAHLRRHMGEEKNQCMECDRILTTRQSFIKHMISHLGQPGRFECEVCHKMLSRRETLVAHMNIHTGDKPFKCHICDKGLSTKHTLAEHVRTHTGERPHVCEICQKSFAARNNLVGHMETHASEKLYECSVCQKRLCTKLVLTDHMRIHTGEKPYKCSLCQKDFATKNALASHTRKIHKRSILSVQREEAAEK